MVDCLTADTLIPCNSMQPSSTACQLVFIILQATPLANEDGGDNDEKGTRRRRDHSAKGTVWFICEGTVWFICEKGCSLGRSNRHGKQQSRQEYWYCSRNTAVRYTNLNQVPHPAHCHRTFTPAEFEQFTFGMSTRGIDTRPCSFPGCVALASKGLQLAMCVFAAMRMKISDISYRIMYPVATSYCCFQHNSATIGNRIT